MRMLTKEQNPRHPNVVHLQQQLEAAVIYASATIASSAKQFAPLVRLCLFGEGTRYKDVKDFDGRETYVDEQIKEESLTWLPSHTSYNIEAQRRAAEAAAAEDSDSDNDDE